MQFVNVPGVRTLAKAYAHEVEVSKDYHPFYRATALFAQGHLLDSYLMFVVLVAVACLFDLQRSPLGKRALLGLVVLDGLAMGSTATVTPILGALAGIFALAFWYGRLKRTLVAVIVAGVCAAMIFSTLISARLQQELGRSETQGSTPVTLAFRWHVWTQQYIPAIEQHLLTGYGPELPPGSVWEFTESMYVTLLLRGGLPLLLIFGWLMWLVARRCREIDDDRRPVARAMWAIVVVLIFMHLVNNYFLDSGLAELWWGVAGLLFAVTAPSLSRDACASVRSSPTIRSPVTALSRRAVSLVPPATNSTEGSA